MNQGQGANLWLAVGGMISLMVHVIGGLAVLGVSDDEIGAADQPRSAMLDQAQELDEPVPGIQDSTSVSINWLGFAEPTETSGQVSETEQPALSMAPMGEPSEQAPAEESEALRQSAPSQRAPVGPAQGEALTAATPTAPEDLNPAPSLAIKPQESDRVVPAGQGALQLNPWGLPPAPERVEGPPAGGSESDSDAMDQGQGSQSRPEEGAQSGADDIQGMPSDRESVATALKEATNLTQWSKPLARKGLEIKTVRPRFRTATLLTRLPRNPVVMVSFGPGGRVVHAEFVRDGRRIYNSGSRDVDEPLLDAVYKWRATGKELESLGKDERIEFAIRIMLRR